MNKNILASIVVVVMMIGVIAMVVLMKNPQVKFEHSDQAVPNPVMGFVPKAEYSEVGEDVSLVYVDVTWSELEPQENVYAWEEIEEQNQWIRWRAEGKHIVLRFVVDHPSNQIHKDIPDWLYDQINHDGDWYDMEYGKGFSPNYANAILIEKHQKAVAAMGERWGNDTFISYVQLGSIGHWGEWHVNFDHDSIRRLPSEAIRNQYVVPWLSAFPNAKILMRRPFTPVKEYQLGVYNDMTGEPKSTQTWLNWLEHGGVYDQTEETDAIVAVPNVWQHAPVGGEFTSAIEMEQLMGESLTETIDLIRQSHMTFIGPKIAQDSDHTQGYEEVLKNVGYRLWLSQAKLEKQDHATNVVLVWQNSGVAPFYFDWPVQLVLYDQNDKRTHEIPVEIDWQALQPGAQVITQTTVHQELVSVFGHLNYSIALEIIDPMTEAAAVSFAVKGQEDQLRLMLFKN